MNLLIFRGNEFLGCNRYSVKRRDVIDHILKVLKKGIGDEVNAGILNGEIGKAVIKKIDISEIIFEFKAEKKAPKKLPITLICAIPRPKFLKRIVRDAVTIGIEKIIFLRTWKVEKTFFDSKVFNMEKLEMYAILGLEQAKDTVMPEIEIREKFKQFIEDELPIISENSVNLIAHPKGNFEVPLKINNSAVIVIGPEGGFTDYEIDCFEQKGFNCVQMGERILRVETAIPFLVGKLV